LLDVVFFTTVAAATGDDVAFQLPVFGHTPQLALLPEQEGLLKKAERLAREKASLQAAVASSSSSSSSSSESEEELTAAQRKEEDKQQRAEVSLEVRKAKELLTRAALLRSVALDGMWRAKRNMARARLKMKAVIKDSTHTEDHTEERKEAKAQFRRLAGTWSIFLSCILCFTIGFHAEYETRAEYTTRLHYSAASQSHNSSHRSGVARLVTAAYNTTSNAIATGDRRERTKGKGFVYLAMHHSGCSPPDDIDDIFLAPVDTMAVALMYVTIFAAGQTAVLAGLGMIERCVSRHKSWCTDHLCSCFRKGKSAIMTGNVGG
jgi:hypothetical protein